MPSSDGLPSRAGRPETIREPSGSVADEEEVKPPLSVESDR